MTTHFYGSRHWGNGTIKIACTGEWIAYEKPQQMRPWRVGNGTGSANQVTCLKCLEIIIGKQENKLRILKDRLQLFVQHGTEWVR